MGCTSRVSSSYFPQSNGRAEVAVKKVKRFLMSCVDPSGSLNTDQFLRGMLQIRNIPDQDCKRSPAQIILGRPLQDASSFTNRCVKFNNKSIHPLWRDAWKSKEEALRARFVKSVENLGARARPLPQLAVGDGVFVQNQCGPQPNKWDRSGILVELRGNDQVLVKVDGTGRLTLRNRRFLRKYTLPDSFVEHWRGNLFPAVEEKLPVTHGVDSANPVTSHTPTCGLIPEPSSDSMQSGNMQPGMVMNPCSESGEQCCKSCDTTRNTSRTG